MTCRRIAMCMKKGGVGKSTLTVNLAGQLARNLQTEHATAMSMRDPGADDPGPGRVLVVDTDPQGNSTSMFLDPEKVEGDLRSIIKDQEPVWDVVRPTRIPNLDVLPARADELELLDKELVINPAGVGKIRRALRGPERGRDWAGERYQYVLFDTQPSMSHLTLGAMAAADYILIPMSAEVWASKGLRKFVAQIEDAQKDEIVTAEIVGVVATMVNLSTRIGGDILADRPTFPVPAFRTYIPRRISTQDNVLDSVVAGEPGLEVALSVAYQDLTRELVNRLEKLEGTR